MLSCKIAFFFTILPIYTSAQSTDRVKVKTSEGIVVGTTSIGGSIAFYGIPYGGPTSGENRFKAAPPPAKYDELVANNNSILCAQPSQDGLLGVEDCLTLNVFTKNVTISKPVIVFLSGEDFSNTNSTRHYSFNTLVEADIVFIQVNYRLSIFGFLCLGVTEAPGNAGLKDVVQALKWIQPNVQAFGGDPNNVLLLGHGSGAAMVDLVTMSSENLVHKAISLSGSALSPGAIAYNPLDYAEALAAKIGLHDNDVGQLAKNLQMVDTHILNKAINTFDFTNQSLLFAPCVENENLDGSFLQDAPIHLLQKGSYKHIPYIAGYVDKEGTMRVREALHERWLERMQENFIDFLPVDLTFPDEVEKKNVSQYLRNGYFGDRTIDKANILDFFAYEKDCLIVNAVLKSVKERAKTSKGAVRLLTFSSLVEDSVNGWPYRDLVLNGTRHGGILDYIFDLKYRTDRSNKLVDRIIAFTKNGIPQPDNGFYPEWDPITNETFYLKIHFKENSVIEHSKTLTGVLTKVPWDDITNSYYTAPTAVSSVSKIYHLKDNALVVPLLISLISLILIIIIFILLCVHKENIVKKYQIVITDHIHKPHLRWPITLGD